MGGLQLLSALNWCVAAIYAGVAIFFGIASSDTRATLLALAITAPFIAVHSYLGATIDKGRGRVLQTVFAVPALLAFPVGTLFGLFALYLCWFGDSAKTFEPASPEPRALPRRPRLLVEDPDRTPLNRPAVRRRG